MTFGLIGAGEAGALRARALASVAGARLAAAADLDQSRARRLAPDGFAEAAKLIERPDLDAVLVCTPPDTHESLAVAALDAGKHVLCEKPLAPAPEAARRMVAAAGRAGRILAAGFNQRYFPSVRFVQQAIAQGRIGEVRHVRAYAGHRGLTEFRSAAERDPARLGGGALMDNGIHLIDLVRHLGGEFDEARGFVSEAAWNWPGAEDNGVGLLTAGDGRWASLHASWTEWRGYRFWVRVYGSRGVASMRYGPLYAEIVETDETGREAGRERRLFAAANVREKLGGGWRRTLVDSFAAELRDFVCAAEGGDPGPAASGEDGLRAVEIAYAVRESSRNGAAVRLGAEMVAR